jgi:hypothetical protein
VRALSTQTLLVRLSVLHGVRMAGGREGLKWFVFLKVKLSCSDGAVRNVVILSPRMTRKEYRVRESAMEHSASKQKRKAAAKRKQSPSIRR